MTTQTPLAATPRTDGLVVYDTDTQLAVCLCGPNPSEDPLAWPDEQVQRTYAALIARLLNEGAT